MTPLFGKAGDLNAVSENEISISGNCIPAEDILHAVQPGTSLSLLGIDLDRRIRHRINGIVTRSADDADINLAFEVKEYSPNCPKYINRRKIVCDVNANPVNAGAIRQRRNELSDSDSQFIQSMDTLWIGTYAPGVGADTNHRGGKPGFIRVTSPTTIEWPE